MKYLLNLLAILLLSGCASNTVSSFTPYAPKEEMKSLQDYNLDLALCRTEALEYLSGKSSINPLEMASAGAQKALGNLGTATVAPVTIPLYGLGGASGEGLSELGLSSQDVKKIISWCMHDHGLLSNQYHVYDPNL